MFAGHLGEALAIVGTVDPVTVANTQVYTDVIDMSKFTQVMGIAMTGNIGASETIDFKAYYCDSDGNNATALKSAAQLAASATANDATQIVIVVRPQDLNAIAESKRYIKFGLVTGGATGGPCGVVALGMPHYGPAADNDLSTVVEIKY